MNGAEITSVAISKIRHGADILSDNFNGVVIMMISAMLKEDD